MFYIVNLSLSKSSIQGRAGHQMNEMGLVARQMLSYASCFCWLAAVIRESTYQCMHGACLGKAPFWLPHYICNQPWD